MGGGNRFGRSGSSGTSKNDDFNNINHYVIDDDDEEEPRASDVGAQAHNGKFNKSQPIHAFYSLWVLIPYR